MASIHSLTVALAFHGVGQGLFSSGVLEAAGAGERRTFHWVYDCGAMKQDQSCLDEAVDAYKASLDEGLFMRAGLARPLDLVVISHFDRDHVAGIPRLLRNRRVDTLLLPYIDFPTRILLAIAEDVDPASDLFQFFAAPSAYLSALEGADIGQILYVRGGDEPPEEGGPEEPGELGPAPEAPDEPDIGADADLRGIRIRAFQQRLAIKTGLPPDRVGFAAPGQEDDETFAGLGVGDVRQTSSPSPFVGILAERDVLRVGGFWEFIPYNDVSLMARRTKAFQTFVLARRDILCSGAADEAEKKATLQEIKTAFSDVVARTGRERNLISLFLAGRPTRGLLGSDAMMQVSKHHEPLFWWRVDLADWGRRGCDKLFLTLWEEAFMSHYTAMMTGDGFLNTIDRVAAFERRYALQPGRLPPPTVALQIMHHGSRKNYRAGIASRLRPMISVFSSNPLRRQGRGAPHPHREVWREFERNNPIQVMQDAPAQILIDYDFD